MQTVCCTWNFYRVKNTGNKFCNGTVRRQNKIYSKTQKSKQKNPLQIQGIFVLFIMPFCRGNFAVNTASKFFCRDVPFCRQRVSPFKGADIKVPLAFFKNKRQRETQQFNVNYRKYSDFPQKCFPCKCVPVPRRRRKHISRRLAVGKCFPRR